MLLTTEIIISQQRSQTSFGFPFENSEENAVKSLSFSTGKLKIYLRDDLIEKAASLRRRCKNGKTR